MLFGINFIIFVRICLFFVLIVDSFIPHHNKYAQPVGSQKDASISPTLSTSISTLVIQSGPGIYAISTNEANYPQRLVPQNEKFEITFQVGTVAKNLQMPYDPNPPAGISGGLGISVEAHFSPDGWKTVYRQPGFYYQDYDDQVKGGNEWFYPTGNDSWKVRFAPNQTGIWQFRLVAQDAGGKTETQAYSFRVGASANAGFIRVSARDSRYFEHENGVYFPGLGYNMNFDHVSWINPRLGNEQNFQIMADNGIQLARIWLSEWGIYGSAWNPWNAINPELGGYIPYNGMTVETAYPSSDVSMRIAANENACMFIGFMKARPAVKRNTEYRVRIRYKTIGITGPRLSGKPYGLAAKTGDWLWGGSNDCDDPGTGTIVTPYQPTNTAGWQILEGRLKTGEEDFLQRFYLSLENVNQGTAFIDYVWIEEDFGGGRFGPNVVSKPWMAHHFYMEQRNSYAFDKVLELAEENGVYIRPVILEKNEYIFNHIDYEGNLVVDDPKCWDQDNQNNPSRCPGNQWFYGNWENVTKVRWLQQAWWRYLQARWGYSPHIHSWELLNEGDPYNGLHYAMAEAFGEYMHQFKPNDHLVSTSFWHSFPRDAFFANPDFSNVDFADIHAYVAENTAHFEDTALSTYDTSMQFGALRPGGAGKPVIRGETGFVVSGSAPATGQFSADRKAVWLHNFIWGGINSGGLIESYWYDTIHLYQQNPDGSYAFDHRSHYRTYADFIRNIPLNNGHYQDASPTISSAQLRAWGQKDLVNGRAHLWIQNKAYTWRNVVNQTPIARYSGTIQIAGFKPGKKFLVEWWDPNQLDRSKQILRRDVLTAASSGMITLQITQLQSDIAVRIWMAAPETGAFLPLIDH